MARALNLTPATKDRHPPAACSAGPSTTTLISRPAPAAAAVATSWWSSGRATGCRRNSPPCAKAGFAWTSTAMARVSPSTQPQSSAPFTPSGRRSAACSPAAHRCAGKSLAADPLAEVPRVKRVGPNRRRGSSKKSSRPGRPEAWARRAAKFRRRITSSTSWRLSSGLSWRRTWLWPWCFLGWGLLVGEREGGQRFLLAASFALVACWEVISAFFF